MYDPNSGYYYHEASGYYYDANTGMYYDSTKEVWVIYDTEKQEYRPYTTTEQQTSTVTSSMVTGAGSNAIEMATLTLGETKVKDEYNKAMTGNATKRTGNTKKKGAVIGAAPQLKPERILEAAKIEKVLNYHLKS